jgi:MoxR-like ATPase
VSTVSNDLERRFPAVGALSGALETAGYLAGDQLAAALFLAVRMGQPILLEGEPGPGNKPLGREAGAHQRLLR